MKLEGAADPGEEPGGCTSRGNHTRGNEQTGTTGPGPSERSVLAATYKHKRGEDFLWVCEREWGEAAGEGLPLPPPQETCLLPLSALPPKDGAAGHKEVSTA